MHYNLHYRKRGSGSQRGKGYALRKEKETGEKENSPWSRGGGKGTKLWISIPGGGGNRESTPQGERDFSLIRRLFSSFGGATQSSSRAEGGEPSYPLEGDA